MAHYRYFIQTFHQRVDALEAALLVAPAEEIATWAGVPQKSSRFMKGFQRVDDEEHWKEIADYFETPKNISPTAIVVAFKPGRARIIPLEDALNSSLVGGMQSGEVLAALKALPQSEILPKAVLEVEVDDFASLSISELATRVYEELALPNDTTTSTDEEEEEDEEEDDKEDEEEDEEEDEASVASSPLDIKRSHLQQFLDFLRNPEALKAAENEDRNRLRDMLENLLRPGTIVDGQHRTRGAAFLEKRILFPVVALLDADWREQVFQFVVINQRAKPIQPEFLSAIISSSLSSTDVQLMNVRLEQAGVRLDNTRIMEMVNSDFRSPFAGKVDFKIEGSAGKLPYPGMLTLARRFRSLRTHGSDTEEAPRFPIYFKQIFQQATPGKRYGERRQAWLDRVWFDHFAAFWSQVRDLIADEKGGYGHLWGYNTNLLKIVTLQELQNLFLRWLYDRMEPIQDPEQTQKLTAQYLAKLKPVFFEKDWKLPSLQSGTGRLYLRSALSGAIKNPKFNYEVPLFVGIVQKKH